MKIVNSTPLINLINNGFVYLCQDDTGAYWMRSVAGKWAQVVAKPVGTDDLDADFQTFLAKNTPATEVDLKADNTDQIVVEPVKVMPAPAPDPVPIVITPPDPVATSTPDIII